MGASQKLQDGQNWCVEFVFNPFFHLFLIYFMPLVSFQTPWKHQKTSSFLCFQGVLKETSVMKWANSIMQKSVYETLCAIWYHLYNLKSVKNTYWGVILLLKVALLHRYFSHFFNCTNGTKLRMTVRPFVFNSLDSLLVSSLPVKILSNSYDRVCLFCCEKIINSFATEADIIQKPVH